MLKITQYEEQGNRVMVSVLYPDSSVGTYNMVNTGDKEGILKDVYIISQNPLNREALIDEVPEVIEEWNPPASVPKVLKITDWNNLQGVVYDQYGSEMEQVITWSIQGPGAKIEQGKVVRMEVKTDTSFFVVANVGTLTEKNEQMAYAPVPEPIDPLAELKSLKDEYENYKIQIALAQAEVYETQEQNKIELMLAIAEAYETLGTV